MLTRQTMDCCASWQQFTLRWRHNGRDDVSHHQPHDCVLNRLFRRRSKKHQSSVSLAFMREIPRTLVHSPHKWPVTRKMFPFDDVIISLVAYALNTILPNTRIIGLIKSQHIPNNMHKICVLLPFVVHVVVRCQSINPWTLCLLPPMPLKQPRNSG